MKPGASGDVTEEIAEVHRAGRSPSPKDKAKPRPRSRSGSRKLSNGIGHTDIQELTELKPPSEGTSDKTKARDSWIKSEQESLDVELPIHDQIKKGILGFVEKEIKKSDKIPNFVFYSQDPTGHEDKLMKTLSRPSSGHKEKKSPSYRKKKRHSSKHRDRDLHDFEIPGSSLSALEKVDDYLKEYNKDEVVTLSGDLEIEVNDVENNNGLSKDIRHKPRKTRRRKEESLANGHDVSPKVFKTGSKSKPGVKPARPTDLTAMLESLESNASYHDQYIDNPFSSPSPLTSPNDDRINSYSSRRPEKIYLQGGGTFREVSRDRISHQSSTGDAFLRLGDVTPLDIALSAQKYWRTFANACHGMLGGLSLLHLILIGCSDAFDASHLTFHAVLTMPYVATYFWLCVACVLSVLDILDVTSLDHNRDIQEYVQSIVLVTLYMACLLVCMAARSYDELMVYQYTDIVANVTGNVTTPTIPTFYYTWTYFSIWRAVLSILGLAYFVILNPKDMVYNNLSKLLQFKQTLQSIG